MMGPLRVHALLHAPFEGIGCIADWISEEEYQLAETQLWESAKFPSLKDFDLLIIMGGTMSVNDEKKHPWLIAEKQFIKQCIENGKQILGICLGAQLIANVLGSKVYSNRQKEIGWFEVKMNENALHTPLQFFPKKFITFHWHGETFDLPNGALHLAQNKATQYQAFTYGENIVALQFHPEMTQASMREMLKNGSKELVPDKYIQTAEEILANLHHADLGNSLLKKLLEKLAENFYKQQLIHVQ